MWVVRMVCRRGPAECLSSWVAAGGFTCSQVGDVGGLPEAVCDGAVTVTVAGLWLDELTHRHVRYVECAYGKAAVGLALRCLAGLSGGGSREVTQLASQAGHQLGTGL